MVEIWLPYGHSEIPVRVPEERLVDILKPENTNPLTDPSAECERAIRSNESFLHRVGVSNRVCIVLGFCGNVQLTTDITRTILQFTNNPQSSTTILCTEEAVEPDALSMGGIQVLRHASKSETKECPPLAGGFKPQIDSQFVNADLRVVVGELRPHQFLGYSGLSDLIFPNLGSEASARVHLGDRPPMSPSNLYAERVEVAKSFDNLFMLGLVLDEDSRPTTVKFGETDKCLSELQPIVNSQDSKQITKRSDIVVMSVGGAPFDGTLARAVEAFPAGLAALKKDGALIVTAECADGHGGGQFYEWCSEHKEPRHLETRLRHHFSYSGFKASFLGRVLQTHRVYLVSTIPDHYVESNFGMRASSTVNGALQTAQRAHGSDSTISVIPNACRIIPTQTETPQ